jgi:hypothetical protein
LCSQESSILKNVNLFIASVRARGKAKLVVRPDTDQNVDGLNLGT